MSDKPVLNVVLILSLLLVMPAPKLYADRLGLFGNWTYTGTESETELRETQIVTKGETERFKQSYRLDVSKELFPNLRLNGGVQVENDKFILTSNGHETEAKEGQIRPFIDAEMSNRLYTLAGGYQERQTKKYGTDIAGTERDYLDNYHIRAEFRPVDLPVAGFSYFNSLRYDDPRTLERESESYQFNSRYDYKSYRFLYNFLRNNLQDKISSTGNRTTTHNGQVRYRESYLDGKLSFNARLRAEFTGQKFSGAGDRDFSAFPPGNSFYLVGGDPDPNNNDPNDYIASPAFGTNLDLNSVDILSVGLSFGQPVEVDMLQVILSAELDANSNIGNSANWMVYVSDDQATWSAKTVDSVDYNFDDNLLEIRFSPPTADPFSMVVYTPPLVTNQVGPVFVSSIQAFVTRFLDSDSDLKTRTMNARMGVNWQVADKTGVSYNLNIQERESNLFDDRHTRLSNSASINHRFNPVFNSSGRLHIVDTWQQGDHETSHYSYSARLTGDYLETLRQSFIYSGNLSRESEGDSFTNSIILRTNAQVYDGWDVIFDTGYSWQEPATGLDSSDIFVRLQNNVVPHRSLTLFADYSITWNDTSGLERLRSDTGRLRLLWVPLDTLSISGVVRMRKDEEKTDTSWEYNVGWLPFRDGDMQISIGYFEKEDPNDNMTRSLSSALSWAVTRRANLRVIYNQGVSESVTSINDFSTVQVNLKIYYN